MYSMYLSCVIIVVLCLCVVVKVSSARAVIPSIRHQSLPLRVVQSTNLERASEGGGFSGLLVLGICPAAPPPHTWPWSMVFSCETCVVPWLPSWSVFLSRWFLANKVPPACTRGCSPENDISTSALLPSLAMVAPSPYVCTVCMISPPAHSTHHRQDIVSVRQKGGGVLHLASVPPVWSLTHHPGTERSMPGFFFHRSQAQYIVSLTFRNLLWFHSRPNPAKSIPGPF